VFSLAPRANDAGTEFGFIVRILTG
jgi:hypothetical protein